MLMMMFLVLPPFLTTTIFTFNFHFHECQLCDVVIQGGTPVLTQLGSSTKTSLVLVPSIPMTEKSPKGLFTGSVLITPFIPVCYSIKLTGL